MTFEHEPQGFVGSKYTNNSNKIFKKETIHYSHTSEYTAKLSDTSKRKDYLNVNRVKSLVCLILGNFLVTWLKKHISEVFNVLRKMPVQQQNKQSSCQNTAIEYIAKLIFQNTISTGRVSALKASSAGINICLLAKESPNVSSCSF